MTAVVATAVQPVYPSEEAALKRAAKLKKEIGMWPGAIQLADGQWQLTTDPEVFR